VSEREPEPVAVRHRDAVLQQVVAWWREVEGMADLSIQRVGTTGAGAPLYTIGHSSSGALLTEDELEKIDQHMDAMGRHTEARMAALSWLRRN
jgi:hypothetical protein